MLSTLQTIRNNKFIVWLKTKFCPLIFQIVKKSGMYFLMLYFIWGKLKNQVSKSIEFDLYHLIQSKIKCLLVPNGKIQPDIQAFLIQSVPEAKPSTVPEPRPAKI